MKPVKQIKNICVVESDDSYGTTIYALCEDGSIHYANPYGPLPREWNEILIEAGSLEIEDEEIL